MFEINMQQNTMKQLSKANFSDSGIKERSHLQEWIADQPDALGEEFLIIQKEFAGFDDTQERLDLLALDTNGSLVIIENKLDDSGRDVVWQGLKYVAYCSTLSKTQIIDIYQAYLQTCDPGADASERICEFLDAQSIDDVTLNSGSDQRLILVAANFRKEVTSAVLWLIEKGVRIQCMKAT
ncbi:MAG: endonuclease NucS domain-containing protein, partial [Pseudomonadota bacterium]